MKNNNWQNDYEKMLLGGSGYSGNKKAGVKKISASSLSSNMLELYLDYKYGKSEDKKFEPSNLGSIYQLGVDKICEGSDQYRSGIRYEYELSNGWTVSGEVDQIDDVNMVIIDNKVTTTTAKKKIIKEGIRHSYAIQLAVYKFLIWKNERKDYTGALALIDKGASYFKPQSGDTMNYMNIDTIGYEEIEQMLLDKTNELQSYIDKEEEPEICADRFPFKSRGVVKQMKCIHYCNYRDHCRHSNEYLRGKEDILSLADSVESNLNEINPFDTTEFNF